MRQPRLRPTYYMAITLHDGTVTSAIPIRRPSKQALMEDARQIDADGVAAGHASNGWHYTAAEDERNTRFLDIFATRLNTRRAIRELVLPRIEEVLDEVRKLNARMERIEGMLEPAAVAPS